MALIIKNLPLSGAFVMPPAVLPPSPPVADFTSDTNFGAVPLTVNFTDTSTNTPTSWLWDFKNDGSATSTQQNPSYTYTTPGSYTVKLTATNAAGSNIVTKSNYITATTEQYFQYTSLLLDGIGTNNAQNNTFLDSSTNNFTVTRFGTTQGSFTPFSHSNGYWSNYFDGSGDYLSIPTSSANLSQIGDWTYEGWAYWNVVPTAGFQNIFGQGAAGQTSYGLTIFGGKFTVNQANGGNRITGTTIVVTGTWYHFALVRSSNVIRLYVNGNLEGTPYTDSGSYGFNGNPFTIGNNSNGYISNFRFNRTAVYTSNFTPSTTPLTAITDTQLLTCQNNNFKDNSTNNFAITSNGDTRVTLFQPFTLSSEYNSSTMGGSMYFDGSNDRLTVANNAAFNQTGSWTVEMWIYSVKRGAAQYFYTQSTSGYAQLTLNSSNLLEIDVSGVGVRATSTSAIPANAWTHVAMVSNGTQIRLFVNGVLQGSAEAFTGVNSAKAVTIGSYDSPSLYFGGYISNLRVVAGTAVYTTNFTPPAAPVTAISGTSLLLNGTNAGIVDSTGFNDAETVGDAKISTAQSKWGGSSMYFDGTGDYLALPTSTEFGLGTSDFTIEGWIYPQSTSSNKTMIDFRVPGSGSSQTKPTLFFGVSNELHLLVSGAARISSSALSTNQWYHVALVRSSGVTKMYLNGTQAGSNYTDTNNYGASGPCYVGTVGDSPGFSSWDGYMQGIRITKGIARYTGTFTPPTDY